MTAIGDVFSAYLMVIPATLLQICQSGSDLFSFFFFSITPMDTPVPLAKAVVRRRSSRPPKSFLNFVLILSVVPKKRGQDMFTKLRLDWMQSNVSVYKIYILIIGFGCHQMCPKRCFTFS